MKASNVVRLVSVALFSCVIVSCQTPNATDGAGYQMTRFTSAEAARLASADPTAGSAIASNNARCRADKACRK